MEPGIRMAVFVDDMYRIPMGRFGRMKMSHMIADTDDELHAMADRIGVARRWHQGDHYEICRSKRALAVEAGAIEVSKRQLGSMLFLRHRGLPMGDPATAPDRLRSAMAGSTPPPSRATSNGL